MSKLTRSLIDYWHTLPAHPLAARRRRLEECLGAVRCGTVPYESLVPFALGDTDDGLVFDATVAFISGGVRVGSARQSAVHDAVEWVRRGLALNRGAVFAALLSVGDGELNSRLAPYRLLLGADETSTIWRRTAGDSRKPTRDFVTAWRELLAVDAAQYGVAGTPAVPAAA